MVYLKKYWFFAAMLIAGLVAFWLPDQTVIGSKPEILSFLKSISRYLIGFTFVVSGVRVATGEVVREIRNAKGIIVGLCSLFLIGPLFAVGLSRVLGLNGSLAVGMILIAAMPTTVTSGVIITSMARGNIALALCLTVVSNILCPFSIPCVIKAVGSHINSFELAIWPMMWRLFLTIVVPFMVGQLLRPSLRNFVVKYRPFLSIINQIIILSFIFTALCGSKESLVAMGEKVLLIVMIVAVLHVLMIIWNVFIAKVFRFNTSSRKAITIVGSQKTLAVAFQVWNDAFGGTAYLIMLPSLLHHIIQTVVDSILALKWASKTEAREQKSTVV